MSFLASIGLKPHAVVNDKAAMHSVRRLVQKLIQREYQEVGTILANAGDESRERLIYGFATDERSVPLAAAWAVTMPRSSVAHTLLGASLIVTGWKARGNSYADDVDAGAWQPFLEGLENAEQPLHMAANLDPASADPWAWLIHAAFAQDAARAELKRLFAEATSRTPLHWPSHYKYFNATTQKWGGSHEEMFAFAHASARSAPRASVIHCLVPAAYNDYALALGRRSHERIRTKKSAAEICGALYAWLNTDAAGLDRRLERLSGGFSSYGLNHFAVACYLCGAHADAKALLQALHGEIESTPWVWIASGLRERTDPAFVHDRVCRELGVAER
ncbi:MAG: hypothetical protein Q8K96_18280 [Rubrivivax sp.]|nr:hypothetical protein [Rubrivivax sp.]